MRDVLIILTYQQGLVDCILRIYPSAQADASQPQASQALKAQDGLTGKYPQAPLGTGYY